MEYRALGKSGLEVSSIGMGCVTLGREIDARTSFDVLDRAWERGVTLFDTAAAYADGESERVLGQWMVERHARDRLVLATKVLGRLTREHVIESAEQSLQRLRTERIDLFQLHNWDPETPVEETLRGLTDLVESGKVRAIGCSNWQAWQLAKGLLLAQSEGLQALQSVQPPYNLVKREIEADLLPLCADQNIGVLGYSPLGGGFLSGKYRRDGNVPRGTRFDVIPGHQPIYFTERGYSVLETLESISRETGISQVQLALGWAVRRPHLTSVLIGARSIEQVDQAFAAKALTIGEDIWQRLDLE